MTRRSTTSDANGPYDNALIAPVTILDAEGRVLRVLAAAEFRRVHVQQPVVRDARRWRRPNGSNRERQWTSTPDHADEVARAAVPSNSPDGQADS